MATGEEIMASQSSESDENDSANDNYFSSSSNSENSSNSPCSTSATASSMSGRILKSSNRPNIGRNGDGDAANQNEDDRKSTRKQLKTRKRKTGEGIIEAEKTVSVDEIHDIKSQRSVAPVKLAEFREMHDLTKLDRITMENGNNMNLKNIG